MTEDLIYFDTGFFVCNIHFTSANAENEEALKFAFVKTLPKTNLFLTMILTAATECLHFVFYIFTFSS